MVARTVEVEEINEQKEAKKKFMQVMKNVEKEKEFCCILVSPKDSVILSHATPLVLMNFIRACASAITASMESMSESANEVLCGFDDEIKGEIDKMVRKEMKRQAKLKKKK